MPELNTEQDQPTLFSFTDSTRTEPVFLFSKPSTEDPLSEKQEPLPLLISISNQLPEIIVHSGVYYVQDLRQRSHYWEASSVYASSLEDTIL